MARVSVSFEDYQQGRMPAVCVLSGEPADETLVYQSPVVRGVGGRGPLTTVLERLVGAIRLSRTYEGVAGRVPVRGLHYRRLVRRRRMWGAAATIGLVSLIGSASAAAPWSPGAAAVAAALIGVAAWKQSDWRRALPRATPSHGGAQVTLDNVHEAFASALADRV